APSSRATSACLKTGTGVRQWLPEQLHQPRCAVLLDRNDDAVPGKQVAVIEENIHELVVQKIHRAEPAAWALIASRPAIACMTRTAQRSTQVGRSVTSSGVKLTRTVAPSA